ncbi:MAG: hypothetical protein LBK82_03820, partial [Planctomycetaceae bacterium]|nr:hypothetical protein [Planctomycetaceae bacterium]
NLIHSRRVRRRDLSAKGCPPTKGCPPYDCLLLQILTKISLKNFTYLFISIIRLAILLHN